MTTTKQTTQTNQAGQTGQTNQTALQEQQKPQITPSERFTQIVLREFGSGVGDVALTDFQKRLAQNYFIAIDATLKMAETKRMAKKRDQDPLPIVWQNANMQQLARNVVSFARMGLDPLQKNHINMVPYKNNTTNQYDIGFIEGYRGIELRAKKYGLEVPDAVIVDLVYTNDKFKSFKKDRNNQIETFEFEVVDEFNRGDIRGGFYYHIYKDTPEKNKLVVFTLKDIQKRKPKYASVEFWGGEKDVWEYDENTGKNKKVGKEHVEGWYEKMCYKTIYRAAYNDITIDSQKIDEDYLRAKQMEITMAEVEVDEEINENANMTTIDITPESTTGEEKQPNEPRLPSITSVQEKETPPPKPEPKAQIDTQPSSQPQNGLFKTTAEPGF
jgi:recombination protein RecT